MLVRAAHSANIKERRDCSTALFDAARRDGHAGRAHPRPPRRDARGGRRGARRGPRARARLGPQRPVPRRHAPARHHRRSRRCSPTASCSASPPSRAHHADVGGPTPGSMPADSHDARRGGRRDRAARARRRRDRRARRADAPARRSAAPTCARSSPPTASARGALRELAERIGADALREAMAEVLDYAERRTRACLAELAGRHARGDATCSRRADGDLELRARARPSTGDELTLDFTGTRRQHDGNLNCPLAVTRSACYFAVRVLTDPDIPPSAGAYRPVDGRSRPRARCSTRGRRPRSSAGNVETSIRVADLVLRGVRPRARPGDDEQPHARQRRLHLLRDARRRPGRVPRRRRPERRARRDEQHAQHAGRGARARVPAARDASTRCGAARAATARHRGGDGVVRELEALADDDATRCSPSAAATRRPAPTAAATARAGATWSTARRSGPKATGTLRAGERLRLETPGGGGHGRA